MHQLAQRITAAVSATSGLAVAAALLAAPTAPAYAAPSAAPTSAPGAADRGRPTAKIPTAVGKGGAISTVDPEASAAGLKVLRQGGNAVDAAVAAAATLGVTEPYSAGIGGGGYFVYYDAKSGKVRTHRRPRDRAAHDAERRVHRPGDRQALSLHPRPGHQRRLGRHARHRRHLGPRPGEVGHAPMSQALKPAIKVATRGFVVDETFRQQTARQRDALPGVQGQPQALPPRRRRARCRQRLPQHAARPDLPALGRKGTRYFYVGALARLMADVVRAPAHHQHDRAAGPGRPT